MSKKSESRHEKPPQPVFTRQPNVLESSTADLTQILVYPCIKPSNLQPPRTIVFTVISSTYPYQTPYTSTVNPSHNLIASIYHIICIIQTCNVTNYNTTTTTKLQLLQH